MQNKEAKELLNKYRAGNCTEAEIALLESWYLSFKNESPDNLTPGLLAEARAKVWTALPVHTSVKRSVKLWPVIAAAAAVVILVTAGLFFYQNNKSTITKEVVRIVPGGNRAILTLADGSKISLTDAADGKLVSEAGITITKTKDGQLVYSVSKAAGSDQELNQPVTYNTITTPRGGQYQINLPDGTKVWLNAASSLRFPTAFVGRERAVELDGEGYFEVSKHKDMPFKVVSEQQEIEVLGTHFNVNSYKDEKNVKTTLLEGKVKVALSKGTSVVLKPGEQSVINSSSIKVEEVNTDDAVAWTENNFVFNNEELGSIMRKISRWYDVDVVCPPELAKMEFASSLSRSKNIKQVLQIMEITGTVHFKVEGRRITVMP